MDAPSTHCLPVIRCDAMELEAAEISLSQSRSGLEQLNQVSPLFRKIWSDPVGSSDVENGDNTMESGQQRLDMGSFCIVRACLVEPAAEAELSFTVVYHSPQKLASPTYFTARMECLAIHAAKLREPEAGQKAAHSPSLWAKISRKINFFKASN